MKLVTDNALLEERERERKEESLRERERERDYILYVSMREREIEWRLVSLEVQVLAHCADGATAVNRTVSQCHL